MKERAECLRHAVPANVAHGGCGGWLRLALPFFWGLEKPGPAQTHSSSLRRTCRRTRVNPQRPSSSHRPALRNCKNSAFADLPKARASPIRAQEGRGPAAARPSSASTVLVSDRFAFAQAAASHIGSAQAPTNVRAAREPALTARNVSANCVPPPGDPQDKAPRPPSASMDAPPEGNVFVRKAPSRSASAATATDAHMCHPRAARARRGLPANVWGSRPHLHPIAVPTKTPDRAAALAERCAAAYADARRLHNPSTFRTVPIAALLRHALAAPRAGATSALQLAMAAPSRRHPAA